MRRARLPRWVAFALAPAAIYGALFVVLEYPALAKFTTHFFADQYDGLQNIWNLWWFHKAWLGHVSPYFTPYLYYPYGTTLVAHTLNPFNGLLALVLPKFLPLNQIYNVIVIFSFVGSGLTSFWLAHYLTKNYWPSILAGALVTFSPYHVAHASGHLQLTSFEWVPLFALFWLQLLAKPRLVTALAAAAALFGVMLCDYYYFFYCVIFAVIAAAWQLNKRAIPWRDLLVSLVGFAMMAWATSGIIALALLNTARLALLDGAHSDTRYSLDLFGAIVPGAHWRFGTLTRGYWSKLPANSGETNVALGIAMIILVLLTIAHRRKIRAPALSLWIITLATFWILALGPYLHVAGAITLLPLPYHLLTRALPLLKLTGMPIRMAVMAQFAAAMIVAMGLPTLLSFARLQLLVILLLALTTIEYLPRRLPTTRINPPGYVMILQQARSGGLLDLSSVYLAATHDLYFQTLHGRPMVGGYISRAPHPLVQLTRSLKILAAHGGWRELCEHYGVRFVLVDRVRPIEGYTPQYQDEQVNFYDLEQRQRCAGVSGAS